MFGRSTTRDQRRVRSALHKSYHEPVIPRWVWIAGRRVVRWIAVALFYIVIVLSGGIVLLFVRGLWRSSRSMYSTVRHVRPPNRRVQSTRRHRI